MKSSRQQPLVSIVIPVYNGSNYMREAIDSALAQTYPNIEVIVVNDGSTDNGETERIALSYGDRISYYYKQNGGVSSALNLGISVMCGDYFSWLSHDDMYAPTKVENAIALLQENADCDRLLGYTGSVLVDADGSFLRREKHRFQTGHIYEPTACILSMLKQGTMNGCAFMIPRSAFAEAGFFDEKMRYAQDALMWYRIFNCGYKIVADNRDNVHMRIHKQQVSRNRYDWYIKDSLAMSDELIRICCENSNKKYNLLYSYALHSAKMNFPEIVRKCRSTERALNKMNLVQQFSVSCMLFYGKIRKYIKAFYYRFILRVHS